MERKDTNSGVSTPEREKERRKFRNCITNFPQLHFALHTAPERSSCGRNPEKNPGLQSKKCSCFSPCDFLHEGVAGSQLPYGQRIPLVTISLGSDLSPCILTSGRHCHYSHSTPLSCRAQNSLSCRAPSLPISPQSHLEKWEEAGGLQSEAVLTPERSSEGKKSWPKRKAALRLCPGNKTFGNVPFCNLSICFPESPCPVLSQIWGQSVSS